MRAILVALLLSGCVTVKEVPILVPCLGEAPKQPIYRYGQGAYPGEVEAVKMLIADMLDAKQYALELQAQHAGCK